MTARTLATPDRAPGRLVAAAAALATAEARFVRSPDRLARRAMRRAEVALARAITTHHTHSPRTPGEPS